MAGQFKPSPPCWHWRSFEAKAVGVSVAVVACEPTTFHNVVTHRIWCKPLGPRASGLTATCVLGLEDKLMNPKGNDRGNHMM